MSIGGLPRRSGAGSRRESGQGTLEYVGIALVAAILVTAIVSAVGGGDPIRAMVACTLGRVVTQSGSCDEQVPPTTYDADGPGVGTAAPGQAPGAVAPDDGGGSAGPPAGWDNAALGPYAPADAQAVDGGIETFREKLDGGWNGVRSGELEDIQEMMAALTGAELDAVVAGMSDEELAHWVDELDDGSVFGSGWSAERRRELWSMIAAKASPETMRRLDAFTDEVQPEYDEVGGDDAQDDPDSPVRQAEYDQVPHALFAGGEGENGLIHPDDLNQGQIGDCWLVASMAAIAQAQPDRIADLIEQNPNGTYTVTLYDDGDPVEVTVTPDIPTVDGDPLFADNPEDGSDAGADTYELWPQLLEKAAAQYYGGYSDLEGDWPSKALELYSGDDVQTHDTDWLGLDDPDPPSADDLESVFDDGGAILVSTDDENRTDMYLPAEGRADYLRQSHAYYVTDVDADAGTVEVANPWGLDDYDPITMTYEEFAASFIRYDVAELD